MHEAITPQKCIYILQMPDGKLLLYFCNMYVKARLEGNWGRGRVFKRYSEMAKTLGLSFGFHLTLNPPLTSKHVNIVSF